VGKIIQFPTRNESTRLVEELEVYEAEIQMCLTDLQDLNEHIVELTAEYEHLLNKLCTMQGIKLPEEL
jgi:chromosome segregation ATPase